MFFAHRWQILLRLILFYFILYLLEIGAGSTSRLPHAEQEVTDHITAWSSGSERADMDVWIHAILVDYNILMSWFILVLTLAQIWSVATFADGFCPLSPLNMPGSYFQHLLCGTAGRSSSILFFPTIFPSGSGPLCWGVVVRGHDQCASEGFQVVAWSHCSGWDSEYLVYSSWEVER